MFGKETLKRIVRENTGLSAKEIVISVMGVLRDFQHPLEPEDDATRVVVKVD